MTRQRWSAWLIPAALGAVAVVAVAVTTWVVVAPSAPGAPTATPKSPAASAPSSPVLAPTPNPLRPPQGNCPPACSQIPDAAWIDPRAIPLDDTYHWASLAPLSEPVTNPRFLADELCAARPLRDEERDGALAARVVLPAPAGQWRLQVQILHWRGDTYIAGQRTHIVVNAAPPCSATTAPPMLLGWR